MDPSATQISLLLVDDDRCIGSAWQGQLELNGIEALTCDSPVSALELIRSQRFDVVVSDLRFAGCSSDDVVRFLKACTDRGIGLLISTGADWDEIPKGLDGIKILNKPNRPDEFLDAIRECHRQNTEKNTRRMSVLIVEDDEYLATEEPDMLNRRGGFEAVGCRHPSEALELMSKRSFDVIVSDLTFPELSADYVADFLKEVIKKGSGLVILSAAFYWDIPKTDGAVILTKPASYGSFIEALEKAKATRDSVCISDEALRRLANPDRHIETPCMKWEQSLLSVDTPEARCALYREYLRREINRAAERGNHPTRELNDLIDRYAKISATLRK